ncbi:MAG: hypothetical protein GY749_19420 [Desulfobacteraceae bacterium]|nr:hypothetical protein [Desulfobacteraceae bacterium]
MALTQAQKTLIEKAKATGGGELGTGLSDSACTYIIATIIRDLNLIEKFPELNDDFPDFFEQRDPGLLEISGLNFYHITEKLIEIVPDADTYFACLAALLKSRLKYTRILAYQPVPTLDQVGPRTLLQYGQMSTKALAGFLLWRKWLFDIDNRAGQETGYLFEPIIAHAIGGIPVSAGKSPVRRSKDKKKGRQVDCIRNNLAYEIKIRVTVAASGQGRWREELDFPTDCKESGFKPVLIVLDPTPNPKLDELTHAFKNQEGEVYIGDTAWNHLEEVAGETMSIFLEKYVKSPISEVLRSAPEELPEIAFKMNNTAFSVTIEGEHTEFKRKI